MGMAHVSPWVTEARSLLEAGDAAALERLTLERAWAAESRRELEHAFDFEAVAFYALRWTLAERWARYDADGAAKRFSQLLEKAFLLLQ